MEHIKDIIGLLTLGAGIVATFVTMRMKINQTQLDVKAMGEKQEECRAETDKRINHVENDVRNVMLNEGRSDERMKQMVEMQRETRRDVKELVTSVAQIAAVINNNTKGD